MIPDHDHGHDWNLNEFPGPQVLWDHICSVHLASRGEGGGPDWMLGYHQGLHRAGHNDRSETT